MANEIKIKVTAENTTRPEFAALKGDIHDVETASDKAGNHVHQLGTSLKETGEHAKSLSQPVVIAGGEMRNFGTKIQGVRSDLKALESGIESGKASLSQLTSAFAHTDDAAQRMDLKKAIDKVKSDLAASGRAHKLKLSELMDLEPSPQDSERFVTKLADGIEGAGPVIPAAIAIGLTASPLIGAAVQGAIIGGVGLGGVVGGVVLAARDPRVKSAFKATADGLKQELTEASSSFIEPTISAIHTLGGVVKNVNFKAIFTDAARFVPILTQGVGAFISSISRGIQDLIHNAGPVITVIGQELGQLGTIIGKGFSDMGKNSRNAADGLRTMLDLVNLTIVGTFALINGLTTVYGWAEKIGSTAGLQLLNFAMRDASGLAQDAGGSMVTLAKKFLGVGDDATVASGGVQTLAEHLAEITGVARDLFGATTNVGQAMDDVKKAAEENGKTLSVNTSKGRENRTMLQHLATALQAQYDATVASNGLGVKTDRVAATNRANFIRLATSMTGSRTEARKLADQLLGIPVKRDVKVNANTHDAQGRLKALQDRINATHGKTVQMTIDYNYRTFGKPGTGGGLASGGIVPAIGHAAEGGPRNGLTLVGENGPELADLAPGTRVHSNGDSRRMLAASGGVTKILLGIDPNAGRGFMRELLRALRAEIRAEAGSGPNSVQLALGGSVSG